MTKRLREYVRDPVSGAGQSGVTVRLKRHVDAVQVESDTTDANGLAEIEHDSIGYPGPVYVEATSGTTTRVKSGNVWGQVGGMIWADDITDVFRALGIGVIPDVEGGLAVTASGSGMAVSVASGVALLKDGVPYVLEAAKTLTVTTAHSTLPRIDRVILKLTREGQSEQGKIELKMLDGIAASVPAATALTSTSATFELSLAQVLVGAGVSNIAADKVTDERYSTALGQSYAFRFPAATQQGDLFGVDSTGSFEAIPVGAANQVLASNGTDPLWSSTFAKSALNVTVGDGVLTPTAPQTLGYITVPYEATITSWRIAANESGSCAFTIKKSTYSGFPTTSSIVASAKPTLTSAQKAESSTLTGWTTAVAAGDVLEVVLDSVTTCKQVTLTLFMTKVA